MDYRRLFEDLALGKLAADTMESKGYLKEINYNTGKIMENIRNAETRKGVEPVVEALNEALQSSIKPVVRILHEISDKNEELRGMENNISKENITSEEFAEKTDKAITLYLAYFQALAELSEIIDKMMYYHSHGMMIAMGWASDVSGAVEAGIMFKEKFNPGVLLDNFLEPCEKSTWIADVLLKLLEIKKVLAEKDKEDISKIKDYFYFYLIKQKSAIIKLLGNYIQIKESNDSGKRKKEHEYKAQFEKMLDAGARMKEFYEKIQNKALFLNEVSFSENTLQYCSEKVVAEKKYSYAEEQNVVTIRAHKYDENLITSCWVLFETCEKTDGYKNYAEEWFDEYQKIIERMGYFSDFIGWGDADQGESLRDYRKRMKKNKPGCFIATAAYGNAGAPEVVSFKKFRDKILQKSPGGRIFIKIYYFLSPQLAAWLEKGKTRKKITRFFLKRILNLMNKIIQNRI